jgi:hypothetical protein
VLYSILDDNDLLEEIVDETETSDSVLSAT